MEKHLSNPVFKVISKCANQLGVEAFVIGGFVRDLFLERDSKDIDVVTLGKGIELAELVHKQLPDSFLSVFKNFGTAQVKFHDLEIEIERTIQIRTSMNQS